jgi:hydroxymethylpyrimidine pyrophosphatase-like HAD family hydrolase
LKAALEGPSLFARNVVSVGDAENDHALLEASGYAESPSAPENRLLRN